MVEQVDPTYWERDDPFSKLESNHGLHSAGSLRRWDDSVSKTPRGAAWRGLALPCTRLRGIIARWHGTGKEDVTSSLLPSPHAPSAFSPVSPLSSSKWEGGERGEIEFKSRRSRSLARFLAREQSEFLSSTSSSPLSVRPPARPRARPSPERRRNDEMGKRILGNTPKAGKQGGRGASLRPSDNRFHDG